MTPTVTPFLKTFIENHIEDIENNRFEKVYAEIPMKYSRDTGILTDIFLESGINPLENMPYIPECYLTNSKQISLIIPENIITIFQNAFYLSNIRKFTVPKHVVDIRGGAFNNASRLVELDMSQYEDNIPALLCYGCINLRKVILPDTLEYIASQSFQICPNLEEFVIKQSRDYVFNNVSISSFWKSGGINIPVKCVDGYVTLSSIDGSKLG